VGLAVAVVAIVLVLLALPVLAVLDPPAGHAADWLGRLAGLVPVVTGVRALAFIVAVVVISRSDARP